MEINQSYESDFIVAPLRAYTDHAKLSGGPMITIETFVHILDLGGTFVFAISGAVAESIDGSTFSAFSSCSSKPEILVELGAIC